MTYSLLQTRLPNASTHSHRLALKRGILEESLGCDLLSNKNIKQRGSKGLSFLPDITGTKKQHDSAAADRVSIKSVAKPYWPIDRFR